MKKEILSINQEIDKFGFYIGISLNKIDLKFLENLIKKKYF